jgi:lysophospholipase L1-like esterase
MPTLHVVGDSISQHYGPSLETYLSGTLAYSRKEGMPGDPAEPSGANGGDSSLVLRYLRACAERGLHWDYLLLNCGLHDLRTDPASGTKQVPLVHYEQNLRQIIPLARSLAAHVIWVRTSPVIDAIHNAKSQAFHRHLSDVIVYNSIADSVMHEWGVAIVDLFGFTGRLGDDVFLDHVHFVEPVRQLQAAFIAGYLSAVSA